MIKLEKKLNENKVISIALKVLLKVKENIANS
jgi:hypothetical protein